MESNKNSEVEDTQQLPVPNEPVKQEESPSLLAASPVVTHLPSGESHPRHHFSKKQLIVLGLGGLIALSAIAGGAFYLGKNNGKSSNKNDSQTPVVEKTEQKDEAKAETELGIKAGDITFFENAKPLGNLKLIKALVGDEQYSDDPNQQTQYYQIGTTKDGKDVIYMLFGGGLGPSGEYVVFANKDKYTVLTHALDDVNQAFQWADTVTIDEKTKLPTLLAPEAAEFGGQKIKRAGFFGDQVIIQGENAPKSTGKKEIGTSGEWKFYRVINSDESSYQFIGMYAFFKNLFYSSYNLNGEMAQNINKTIAVKWTKGENNVSAYDNAGVGCGNNGFMIPKNVQKSQLTQVGTSPQGQKLYQLPTSHQFVKDLYSKDYQGGSFLEDKFKNLTIDQLTDMHAYIMVENSFGDYVVMLRNDIFARGGCAKPVIYLYPTQATNVSVAVGADVTLSDPLYPTSGWKNVLAQPNGDLTYQGKQYGSLFWEGYGHGVYPEIKSGTVVPTSQALSVISRQLHEQGMNDKESAEFINFWKGKLPSKPYIRLTWFGNKELNELAPLRVTPYPQTVIRVFLDAEGLDKPINLPAQHFTAPIRKGFTLTEWGGLARDGSVPKLR